MELIRLCYPFTVGFDSYILLFLVFVRQVMPTVKVTCPLSSILSRPQPLDITVTVEPVFLECCKPEPEVKIGLNVRVGLTCEATWVVAPAHLVIMNVARV